MVSFASRFLLSQELFFLQHKALERFSDRTFPVPALCHHIGHLAHFRTSIADTDPQTGCLQHFQIVEVVADRHHFVRRHLQMIAQPAQGTSLTDAFARALQKTTGGIADLNIQRIE